MPHNARLNTNPDQSDFGKGKGKEKNQTDKQIQTMKYTTQVKAGLFMNIQQELRHADCSSRTLRQKIVET